MNEEKVNGNIALDDENQSSKEGKKRVSYVAKDLKSMIDFVGRVYNQLGHTTHHSNKAIAAVHGLSSDSIKQHLTAAQHYKLLEIKFGIGYKITEHFQKIYLPKNDNEKRAAVIESLKNPETYQQLFKDYEYHLVPPDGVKNHFKRNFQLKEDVAAKAALVFMDNLREYNLLDDRGVLISALPSKPIITEVEAESDDDTIEKGSLKKEEDSLKNEVPEVYRGDKLIFQTELDRAGKKNIPIYLTEGKQALFVYPDNIDEDDIELVKHQIDGILLRIKLETKKNKQGINDTN
jgi:hypothetical protein